MTTDTTLAADLTLNVVSREPQDLPNTVRQLIDAGAKFGTIYADPPWQYVNQATRAATRNHYPTMTVEELCELPVSELAADESHLHLWTTNAFLFDANRVLDAWGYEYKSCLVWVKPQMGLGNYWRVSHEFLLLGVRGGLPFASRNCMDWVQADRLGHSRKPKVIRNTIETVSPAPRLELFARKKASGWEAYGNHVPANCTS